VHGGACGTPASIPVDIRVNIPVDTPVNIQVRADTATAAPASRAPGGIGPPMSPNLCPTVTPG